MEYALIGNGGHAREVQSQMGIDLIKFISDEYYYLVTLTSSGEEILLSPSEIFYKKKIK